MSETETGCEESTPTSCIEKAIVESCFWGWAEAWHGVGSIESNLRHWSAGNTARLKGPFLLFAYEVSEVCDSILTIAHQLSFRLCALKLFALNVG